VTQADKNGGHLRSGLTVEPVEPGSRCG
jgi:hypothetical protein